MQVYLTLTDKAARELSKLREELEAVRRRALAAEEAGGRSAKADLQKATNEAYLKTAELKAWQNPLCAVMSPIHLFLTFHTANPDREVTGVRPCLYTLATDTSCNTVQHREGFNICTAVHHRLSQVPAVQEYIKDLLDSDQKFLAFAHHTSLMDGMEAAFRGCDMACSDWRPVTPPEYERPVGGVGLGDSGFLARPSMHELAEGHTHSCAQVDRFVA